MYRLMTSSSPAIVSKLQVVLKSVESKRALPKSDFQFNDVTPLRCDIAPFGDISGEFFKMFPIQPLVAVQQINNFDAEDFAHRLPVTRFGLIGCLC
jgi:hypothetical protein